MAGKMFALSAALLLSTAVHAQTSQNSTSPAQGVTSGLAAAGSPTSMGSPQAGCFETKHQRKVVRDQRQSVRSKAYHPARNRNNEVTAATGSSSPSYALPPR
jgi:hypothetical protein